MVFSFPPLPPSSVRRCGDVCVVPVPRFPLYQTSFPLQETRTNTHHSCMYKQHCCLLYLRLAFLDPNNRCIERTCLGRSSVHSEP